MSKAPSPEFVRHATESCLECENPVAILITLRQGEPICVCCNRHAANERRFTRLEEQVSKLFANLGGR